MTKENSFPESLLKDIRNLSESATEKANKLKAEAKEADRVKKVLADIDSLLNKGWYLHILELMDKETSLLKKMRTEDHPAIPSLEEIYKIAKEQVDTLKRRFPAYLEKACTTSDLSIDRTSSHPRYTFEGRFFQLDVDDKKGIARLSNYEGKLDEFPADIGAVIDAVQREHKRIFGRTFDGKKFLSKLRSQYLAVVKKEKVSDGDSIPIRHITRRLGKNQKRFRTDEFLVDLSRLVEKGPTEIKGRKLDLQQTRDTNQGMLLLGAAGRGYIGFILFKEV